MRQAVFRARQDVEEGDLGQAKRRLLSLLSSCGYDPEVLTELGCICHRMKDPTEAGRYWLTSPAEGPEVDAAIELFFSRSGRSAEQAAAHIPRFARLRGESDYPRAVRDRLNGLGLTNAIVRPDARFQTALPERANWLGAIVGITVMLFVLGTFAVGLFVILRAAVRAIL